MPILRVLKVSLLFHGLPSDEKPQYLILRNSAMAVNIAFYVAA
jgi:hypothetical protein